MFYPLSDKKVKEVSEKLEEKRECLETPSDLDKLEFQKRSLSKEIDALESKRRGSAFTKD
jgi:chaperonin cofactor prefoldin